MVMKNVITCHKNSKGSVYISGVAWNGKPYSKNFITYASIMRGGKLDIYFAGQAR
jgi:putative alpha-1,2-mannosidase